jgi:hypothetical protein
MLIDDGGIKKKQGRVASPIRLLDFRGREQRSDLQHRVVPVLGVFQLIGEPQGWWSKYSWDAVNVTRSGTGRTQSGNSNDGRVQEEEKSEGSRPRLVNKEGRLSCIPRESQSREVFRRTSLA